MHDETLERRLRATLHEEAERQPFTITAAELERRVALRGRTSGSRRLTLLLAAMLAIGAIGAGGLIGGVFNDRKPDPSPVPSSIAQATDAPPTATDAPAPALLPDLDALIASTLSGEVVFAQSNGPAEGPPPVNGLVSWAIGPPFIRVDLAEPGGIYAITLACIGSSSQGGIAEITLQPEAPDPDVAIPCDGQAHNESIDVERARVLDLSFTEPASWRVVVRHAPSTGPTAPPEPAELQAPAGHQELFSRVNETTASDVLTPTVPGMLGMTHEYGGLLPREVYVAQASCVGGPAMRFALGSDGLDGLAPSTVTQVPCDGLAHSVRLGIAAPNGRQVFVGAEPTVRWSLLITSTTPPVALAEDIPGWTLSAGIGPNFDFEPISYSFAGLAVDGGGPFMVVLDCSAVLRPVPVIVQDDGGRRDIGTFLAPCTGEGTVTSWTFETSRYDGVRVEYQGAPGKWTALSILVPEDAVAQ